MTQDKSAAQDAFFPSYAHLVMFAAALGYENDEFDDDVAFSKGAPYPIPVEIFKNAELYEYALVLTLARAGSHEALQDPEIVAKTIEGYSSAGFRHLAQLGKGHDLLGTVVHEISKVRG